MNRDIDYVLNYMTKYVKDKYMHDSEPMLNHKDIEMVLKYIYEKEQELERYKNIIDKTVEYTERFTNGKTSRIDTFENVELVLETILQILKGA